MKLNLTKYGGNEGQGEFEYMSFDAIASLRPGDIAWVITPQGDARRVKINGVPKTWVRRPFEIEVPCKYGLYEYFRVSVRRHETQDRITLSTPVDFIREASSGPMLFLEQS